MNMGLVYTALWVILAGAVWSLVTYLTQSTLALIMSPIIGAVVYVVCAAHYKLFD